MQRVTLLLILSALSALFTSPQSDGPPHPTPSRKLPCYEQCMRDACRDACADAEEHPDACKSCLEAYDKVCVEQCKPAPAPRPQPPPSS